MISGQHLVVGIETSGTLKHPKLKLFSEPSGLSDTNILSYLILGASAHQATENQTQMLFQTAQLMGVGGANAASGIQSVFGLTDFGVEQVEVPVTKDDQALTTQPAFGIGKYITPRLYMHYSVGISNPISILNLTYYISHLFMLQTETSSVDQGADIFYTFESN
jgi:translocation and assembly module TamB